MAPGWRREDPEVAPGATGGPWEGLGGGRGGHERSELTFSSVLKPSDALSRRFPMLLGPRTLSLDACAAKSSRGEWGATPWSWFFVDSGPWAGNLKGGDIRTFLADTVYLLLDA